MFCILSLNAGRSLPPPKLAGLGEYRAWVYGQGGLLFLLWLPLTTQETPVQVGAKLMDSNQCCIVTTAIAAEENIVPVWTEQASNFLSLRYQKPENLLSFQICSFTKYNSLKLLWASSTIDLKLEVIH